jgi:hypothetical protein
MKRVLLAFLALGLIIPFPARAQSKPDFSGTWTLDASRSETPALGRGGRGGGRGGGGAAGPVTIKQTATELTVEVNRGGQTVTTVYKLDGTPTEVAGGRGGTGTAKAHWDGSKLVIETTRDIQGFSLNTKEVRTLDAGGKEMTVETTASTPQGEQTFKQIFTKS